MGYGQSGTRATSYDFVQPPVSSMSGRELAAFVLATTLSSGTAITATGGQANAGDTTKDVQVTGFTVSPVVASRPLYIQAEIGWFTGVTGAFTFKLYDLTSNTVLDQDSRSGVTAFAAQPKIRLGARVSPAAGARTYAVKVNGTAGAVAINGLDAFTSSFLRVTEI